MTGDPLTGPGAPAAPPVRIAFLGFGLIAGSIARALCDRGVAAGRGPLSPGPSLVAWSPSGAGPQAAVRDGVLTDAAATPEDAIEGAGLVVIGAPPIETIELLEQLGGPLRGALGPDAVVTDVASTKGRVVAAADAVGLRFVGGHPMAGREVSGYAGSTPDLLDDRPWVLVPAAGSDAAAIATVTWLAEACGARPMTMDAPTHDAAAAAISHLPLLVAAALVEAVAGAETERPGWPAAAPLASSGWRDMTRLARGDARMGAGIAATNAGPLVDGLREVRAALDQWIEALSAPAGPASAALEAHLRAVRDRLERPPGRVG